MIQKIGCWFSCVFIFAYVLCFPFLISAEQNPAHGTITVDTVVAMAGDVVIVPIRIENNPGMMAITVSITYDSDALVYEKYIRGYLKDYTVADHPGKNLIRFVNCENRNRYDNGIMISLQFRVKDSAALGLHPISIEYNLGDFCDYRLIRLTPVIIPGGVKVIPDCMQHGGHHFANGFCEDCGVDEKIAPFDFNGDTELNALDFSMMQTGLLTRDSRTAFDTNGDGAINILDFVQMKKALQNQ